MWRMTGSGARMAAMCICAILLCSRASEPAAPAKEKPAPGKRDTATSEPVEIQMKNVNFRLARDIALEVRSLRGRLQRTNPATPVTFDDAASFKVTIDSAEVAMTAASLSALLNSYVLAYPGAPIKNVEVSFKDGRILEKGTMHKGVDVAFEIEGSLSTNADGNVRMHAEKIRSAHIPVKGLLHLFGEDLSKLVNRNAGRGMTIAGDDIILDLRAATPPPHLEGRITRVGIEKGKIVQFFDSGRRPLAPLKPPFQSGAYIYHRGGVVRFGKLTMTDTDLEIVGDRPGLFDFFQREYLKQLVAGYSKTTPAKGLVAHMANYSSLE